MAEFKNIKISKNINKGGDKPEKSELENQYGKQFRPKRFERNERKKEALSNDKI